MNKVLEILNKLRTAEIVHENTIFYEREYDEAIAELEKAMKPKSCYTCKKFNGTQICKDFVARSGYESKDFFCSRFEPKEQL